MFLPSVSTHTAHAHWYLKPLPACEAALLNEVQRLVLSLGTKVLLVNAHAFDNDVTTFHLLNLPTSKTSTGTLQPNFFVNDVFFYVL